MCKGALLAACTTMLSACSFVLGSDSNSTPTEDAAPPDASTVSLPFSDNFDGEIDPRWALRFESGDNCEIAPSAGAMGDGALRCMTNGTSATLASLEIDIADTTAVRIELDIWIEDPGFRFVSFAQARNVEGNNILTLSSIDHFNERGGELTVTHFGADTFFDRRLDQEYPTSAWYPVVADISISEGNLVTVLRSGTDEVTQTTTALAETINRITIGAVLTLNRDEVTDLLINNFSISPL